MNKIDLTFGIPMYNAEKYILELLNCFKYTDEFTYEIIVVDDGSLDNSYNLCNNYNGVQIRLLKKMNGGVSSTRNFIIDNAKGRWITFVDSDDIVNFEEYSKSFLELTKNSYDFFINVEDLKVIKNLKNSKKQINILIEKEIINSPCMKFYDLKIIRNNSIRFDEGINLGEDLLFNLEYLKCCKYIGFFCNKIYEYRNINDNSLTHKYRRNKFEILMNVYQRCCNVFDEKKINYSFEYIRIKNSLSCLKSEMILGEKNRQEIIKYIKEMKKYKKIQCILAIGIKENIVYYSWYILPACVLHYLFKLILKNK